MSADLEFVPFVEVRIHLASALEGVAKNLSSLLDHHLDCFRPGFSKAEMVKSIMPERRLIFEAQQCAFVLKQFVPVIPDAVVAGNGFYVEDEAALLDAVLDDLQRATVLANKLVVALRLRMRGDA